MWKARLALRLQKISAPALKLSSPVSVWRSFATGELRFLQIAPTTFCAQSLIPQHLSVACAIFCRNKDKQPVACGTFAPVLQRICSVCFGSIFRLRREFHEEWLRDEPCDATTTGLKPLFQATGVNSLLETGNMRFGAKPCSVAPRFSNPPICMCLHMCSIPRETSYDFYPPPLLERA